MPAPEVSDLFQRAVIWPSLGVPDAYGQATVDIAQEIAVRWKWGYSNMLSPQRESILVDATVVTAIQVSVNTLIWLGTMAMLAGTAGPNLQTPDGLCQVKAIKYTPDIDNRYIRRTLGVIRYKGPLPVAPGQG